MSLLSLSQPQKYTNTLDIGKKKDTGVLLTFVQTKDVVASSTYFEDISGFLPTSTAGTILSSFNTSALVAKDTVNINYTTTANRPSILRFTRPALVAPIANAQIDVNLIANMNDSDTIRVVYISNVANANGTVRFASDIAFANTLSFNIIGSATLQNGQYVTVADLKVANGTVAGTFNPSTVIRARFIGTNSSATNKIAPVIIALANNSSQLPGSILSYKVCCLNEFDLKREMDTAELKCGRSTVGETATSDKFTFMIKVAEEDANLMAFFAGTAIEQKSLAVPVHISGYTKGQDTNPVLGDVVGNPTLGKVNIGTNQNIASVVINCATLQYVNYSSTVLANIGGYLGEGQYTYNFTTGDVYFSALNVNEYPEIMVIANKTLNAISPTPLELGYIGACTIVDENAEGKKKYYFIKKLQTKFLEQSVEEDGNTQEAEMTCYFGQKGDVVIAYDI